MLVNKSSIRMAAASRIQKISPKKNIDEEEVVETKLWRSTAIQYSALMFIESVQGIHRLESTVEIVRLASAAQKRLRKIGCRR